MTGLIRILFVCSRNVSLSPMAAQIFLHLLRKRKILEHFVVDSAALAPDAKAGLEIEQGAKECLANAGIGPGSHTSALASADDSEKYDWIVCMGEAGRRRCLDIFRSNAVYVTPNDVRRVYKTDPASPYSLNGMVKPRVCCLMDFTGAPRDVIDPTESANGGAKAWRSAFAELSQGCTALLTLSPFVPSRS